MKNLTSILSAVIIIFFPASLISGTIHVPSEYETIQDAIDASNDGDTILIADGIYSGNGNINIELNEKEIVIKSLNGPETCRIDGSGTENAVCFSIPDSFSISKSLAIIDGFTIQNFSTGFYLMGSETACVIKNNIIKNCNSAIYSGNGAHPLFLNNEITDNINYGVKSGIIYLSGSCTTLDGNFIHQNKLFYDNAGIIYCTWNDSSLIENNKMSNNTGCVINVNQYAKGVKINGNAISGNSNNAFSMETKHNQYNDPFQGFLSFIYDRSISVVNESSASIRNNLILGNTGNFAGGIFIDNNSFVEIINNDLIGNSSGITTRNPSSVIMNNIIANTGSMNNLPRLQRWIYDTLIMQVYYEGAKRSAVKYFFGFKNNGETGDVRVHGNRLDTTFLIQSGECYLVETTSFVDTYANGGGIYLTIQMGADILEYSNTVFGIDGTCIYLYDTKIQSYGLNNPGMTGSETGIYGIADDPFHSISYNDMYNNLGGDFCHRQPGNAPTLTKTDLPDTDGNISKDPLFDNNNFLSVGSPCIDAGNPEEQYNDASLPPGLGTIRNDMGISGGSMNADIDYRPLSVLNYPFNSNIRLYPNPTSGILFISTGNEYKTLTVEVYAATGQRVEKKIIQNDYLIEIELKGPVGLYLISLQSDTGECESFKICKK
jgi:Periplasmic copper-binding protein (NosD)/Secretion system C-terminal sorting domain